ncbi:homoserine dehydrogenase [Mucilaginibacter sp. RS28]|uniref:Homoserine dehydrogenase n=1 Tax=Mucilaginibacter straminoryzae TaxID=2932774 RepID=A0A9X2B7I9_9SPHI|nr:homoserine dehydrogenase [Mucilaginibacter straminoryzae]MCJ8208381.1 homoserine dehydrogenase [Mucilaginibacter straminoryzae]
MHLPKKLTLGLFGFGVVGQGLLDIISSKNLNLSIKKIGIKHPEKQRTLSAELFTTNPDEIINDPEIDTVVELINDADAAYELVKRSLLAGKSVVSANKKLIAEHLPELISLAEETGKSFLYEGAACASIPIIRNLEEYYDNELLHEIRGIVNGSSNYILSKIYQEQMTYHAALKQAQDLGFAETDPLLDVGGYDPKFKLSIIAAHAYGLIVDPAQIFNYGIQYLSADDIRFSTEKGVRIKLVARAIPAEQHAISLFVMPAFVTAEEPLYQVENEYNGVVIQAAFADRQFFYGKGAGGHPTGSAVLSDIAALRYDYRYEYKKYHTLKQHLTLKTDQQICIYLRYEHEQLVEALQFDEIIERFNNRKFKYVMGLISLEKLIANREKLLTPDVFLCEASVLT